jgi:hypothetical protein
MQRAFRDLGALRYDLGTGYEEYKYSWSPTIGKNYVWCRGGTGPASSGSYGIGASGISPLRYPAGTLAHQGRE